MPNVDGSIRIDARIDASNMKKDAKQVEKQLGDVTQAAEELQDSMEEAGEAAQDSLTEGVGVGAREADKAIRQANESAGTFAERLKAVAGSLEGFGVSLKSLGVGLGLAGMIGAGVKSAAEIDRAMNDLSASTGKTRQELQGYEQVLKDIYKNNYGDSFGDISDAMGTIVQQLGQMDDTAMQEIAESAFALRDTFGYEVPDSVRAAKAMMDQFGISTQKAFQLIASGAQNGLDFSGEMLDSIEEYSVQFAKAGVSADQMFQIMQSGADAGAFNLDKVGDAIKELSIRAVDGSDTTAEGLRMIGLDAGQIAEQFASGGYAAQTAFQQIVSGLAEMQDPVAQNIAGVDLFGTMWEDLGPSVIAQLAGISNEAYGTADALTQIKETKYNDLASVFDGLKRSIELAAVPLGNLLMPALAEMASAGGDIADSLGGALDTVSPLIELVSDAFSLLAQNADTAFYTIAAGATAMAAAGVVEKLVDLGEDANLAAVLMNKAGIMVNRMFGSTAVQIGALAGMFAMFLSVVSKIHDAWDQMSEGQKVVAVFGALAIAAGILAVALHAIEGVGGIALVVAGIAAGAAGVIASLSAVNAANAKTASVGSASLGGGLSWANPPVASAASYSIPRLATGAVIPPNSEFLAVLGDQRTGRNFEAPESLLRQVVREESGGAGGDPVNVNIRFEGSLAQLARVLRPYIQAEGVRKGGNLVKAGDA